MTKKKTVEFEEGWADELMEDMGLTQEDVDNLMKGIVQLIETGEIVEDDDDDYSILERMNHINTRH